MCSRAEVLAPVEFVLAIELVIEVLDQGVMNFAIAFNQQCVVPSNIRRLMANMVDFYAAKYIDGFIKQFFEFWNLRDGRWGINFGRVIFTFFGGIP